MAKTTADLKAKGIELGQPLSDEVAASFVSFLDFMEESEKQASARDGRVRLELPTSQAETDERLGKIKDMPAEQFKQMAEMITKMESPAAEEMMAQTIAALKAKGIELGLPLSDEDAPFFVSSLTSLPPGKIMVPESQAEMDAMLGQFRDMPREVFEQMKMMAAQRAGKGDKAFSITAEELVTQTVAAFKVRAAELGQTLSEEDFALLASSMGQASATLPESQAEVDEKLGQIYLMGGADFEGMVTMIKGMAAKGAGKGE